jgi:hypothetical protein
MLGNFRVQMLEFSMQSVIKPDRFMTKIPFFLLAVLSLLLTRVLQQRSTRQDVTFSASLLPFISGAVAYAETVRQC